MKYCSVGHSYKDFAYSYIQNLIYKDGRCSLCTKNHFSREFKTWSSGNDWKYYLIGEKVALKEIKDSRCNMEFLKVVAKINILASTALGLKSFHEKYSVHFKLHCGNILIEHFNIRDSDVLLKIDLSLCNPENVLFGPIPYIPPEVLRGNEFTRKGDIYSFGGIMYELVTAQRPFADQAHDTYLMIDICNGVRPFYVKLDSKMLKIADENQKNTSKSRKQELLLLSDSNKLLHINRYIHTLHGLHDILEELKSGKSSDPNL
ncbi:hypothetical protein Glove_155g54 [Diversispora epigaea]|uniref:Protein kinase domain-containing protein n=1 Tax=Diversispora epigaea TaxID=1348612 RepID=A0A397ISE3_9GLOM|nr:hypothetical protein Glove_155g54 [Diversispora epigaea]